LRFETHSFDDGVGAALRRALPPNGGSAAALAQLHQDLGGAFGRAARSVAGSDDVAFVASHGQTIWHDGSACVTLQLGDAFVVRELAGVTVCFDFRGADCAAGGQGAPLVARVDALLLGDAHEDRAALNLGGIANVTLLRAGAAPECAIAFDTGPGNMLIDAFVRERTGGAQAFDRDGALAAAGRADASLLDAMLGDDYFAVPPPKTTGRERFGAHFLERFRPTIDAISLEDGAATLAELTAVTVTQAIERNGFGGAKLSVSGGGAHNGTLLARIAARHGGADVETSDTVGIPVDAKEAMAFAVLGYETLRGRAANVPAATGARRAVALGAIAPVNLGVLLERVAAEVKGSQ
jgi:anhydro-N-acetylmuramic acid kinase